MQNSSVVKVERVTKRFAGHTAVDELTMEVPAGGIFGLLGPNGAGKSTTIRMLMNIITPDEGRIAVRAGATSAGAWMEIANTAVGLDADELPRLFDRFYRRERGEATDGRRQRQAGSGLGLPIARDLAQVLGGTLDASLRDGQLVMTLEIPSRPRVHESP